MWRRTDQILETVGLTAQADAYARSMSGGGRQRLVLYARGYHMLLLDLQAETVWRDIVGWIEHPAQPLASGADSHARECTVLNF